MENEKKHWYDGWFYDKIIAPNQDKLFEAINSQIEPGSKVIDIGCGTGRFCFQISEKCSEVVGVDLSSENITTANRKLTRLKISNLKFFHGNAELLSEELKTKFDYAVITFVLHEISPEARDQIIKETRTIAKKIIIGDYLVPVPKGFTSFLNKIIEFLAGPDHFNNFNSFVNNGGPKFLVSNNKLEIIHDNINIAHGSELMIVV